MLVTLGILCLVLCVLLRPLSLKLENILVNKTPSGGFSVTLADFGLAKRVGVNMCRRAVFHSPCGTPGYMGM